jgi:hypothetical protein
MGHIATDEHGALGRAFAPELQKALARQWEDARPRRLGLTSAPVENHRHSVDHTDKSQAHTPQRTLFWPCQRVRVQGTRKRYLCFRYYFTRTVEMIMWNAAVLPVSSLRASH